MVFDEATYGDICLQEVDCWTCHSEADCDLAFGSKSETIEDVRAEADIG